MIDMSKLKSTEESRTFMLKGRPEMFEIYLVPLESLRYNLQNGRIASYITEYEDTKGILPQDYDILNDEVEKFIVESNERAFKKTKNNIKLFDQLEPAVVLSTGVVVDGNRRFSALRQLHREGNGAKFGYLKAAVIDEKNYTPKEIKTLELNLQHARDVRVDYNPIERLVDIYRDLLRDEAQFTVEEYARETDTTIKKINEDIEVAKLLVQYLEFLNQPLKFHIARHQNLDGPLREVFKILRSQKIDDYLKEDVRELLFANILTLNGDVTRKIRELKIVMEDPNTVSEYLEEVEEVLESINDYFQEEEVHRNIEKTNIVNIPEEAVRAISKTTEMKVEKKKLSKAQKQPIEAISKTLSTVENVDIEAACKMEEADKDDFMNYISKIKNKIQRIEDLMNA